MRDVFGDYSLDTQRYELRRAGAPIPLGPQVFDVLPFLVAQRNRVASRDELFARLWPQQFVTDDALGRCIRAARRHPESSAMAWRRSPFVGRARELALLKARLSVVATGQR